MMNSKFQVGDLVRIRDDIREACSYGPDGVWLNEDMYNHRGMVFAIKTVFGSANHPRYSLDDPNFDFRDTWVWEESFLEPVETSVEVDATPLL